ncbi:SURF1 family protein [Phycobium rhodophyticola]
MRRNLPFLIFAAAILVALVSLGNWQLRRMGEKADYLAAIEARLSATPVPVPATPAPETDRFLAVSATGQLTGPETHILVSTRDFGAGFRIIQAFETDGRKILVDRGFIPTNRKSTPAPARE